MNFLEEKVFELVFPLDVLHALPTAQFCMNLVGQYTGKMVDDVTLYHSPLKQSLLGRKLRNRKSFHLEIQGTDFELASLKNQNLSFLSVVGAEHWEVVWVKEFANMAPLISARLFNKEYEHWQNAEDLLEYEARGRSMEGLTMKSNDLPPPLNQTIVDTSRNPGRRILQNGYIEAIGHRMWLGPEFFRRVPRVKKRRSLHCPGSRYRKNQVIWLKS